MWGVPFSRAVLLAAVLALVLAVASTSNAQSISLNFNNEMILQNAIDGADFNVTNDFAAQITGAINTAAQTGSQIVSSVYAISRHLVVVSSAWSTGEASTVNAQFSSLATTFDGWRQNPSSALYNSLSQVCRENIGRQPSQIDISDACAFYDSTIDPSAISACRRTLTVSFLTTSAVSGAGLKDVLCLMLPTNCALVSFTGATTETIVVTPETVIPGEIVQQTTTSYNVLSYTVAAGDRDAVLVTLVNYASHASVLSAQNIAYIRVNGVQVYFRGQEPRLTYEGTMSQCVSNFWYLIFLIILVPIALILSQRSYLLGVKSGRKSIKETEKEIRASLHFTQNPWGAFGGGGMPVGMSGYGPTGFGYGPQGHGMQGGGTVTPQGYGPQGGAGWPSMRGAGVGGFEQQQVQASGMVPQQQQMSGWQQQDWHQGGQTNGFF